MYSLLIFVLQSKILSIENAYKVLKKYWNYDSFRPPQKEIISAILDSKNVIGLLPTGAGKSVCFQVPGIVREGLTIVISPLIALMEDQVSQLQKKGIKATFLHSAMTYKEIDIELDNAIYGNYQFLYVSPERLHAEMFLARRDKMKLSLIAIDEAHCISQWGHDFRPAYLKILEFTSHFKSIPISAFTATATAKTVADIKQYLGLQKAELFTKSFVKENLSYTFIKTTDKINELLFILEKIEGSGIIYVRNRKLAESLSSILNMKNLKTDFYHAGLSYLERQKKQKSWMEGDSRIVISTNAFGMGVDKADVRWVIHVDIPNSIEEYYQEAGRAGRDGQKAYAITLYDDKDHENSLKNMELSQINHLDINFIYEKLCVFFNIAMGDLIDEALHFDINLFCKEYKLPLHKVLAVLKALEQAEIIQTTESLYRPSTLFLNQSRETYLPQKSQYSDFQNFLLSIIRNYEGLFTQSTKIGEEKLARLSNLDVKQVVIYLNKLNELEMGIYVPRSSKPSIQFLTVRTEAKSLSIDYKRIDTIYDNAWEKLEFMLDLLKSNTCREQKILAYFGEISKKNCGRCDICKGSAIVEFDSSELSAFLNFIQKKLKSEMIIFDFLHWWPHNKRRKVLHMLTVLENEKKIRIANNKISLL